MSRFLTKILNERPGEIKAKLEAVPKVDQSQPNPVPQTTQTIPILIPKPDQTLPKARPNPVQSQPNKDKTIAPEKDYNKRANSLERDALPNGLFPGASKAIYDALYLRTLGSINPSRTIQATRKELMKWSGIKNIKTINTHLKRLKDLKLIRIKNFVGEHTGSYYEVFLPQEVDPDHTQSSQTKVEPDANQKMDSDQDQKMVWVGMGNLIEKKGTYEIANTSLKTNTKSDDEAFVAFNEVFTKACEKVSGKLPNKNQQTKWKELAELLVMELEVAAARTKSVSDVPAFLTEHLRRRLMPAKREASKTKSNKSLPVGKQQSSAKIEEDQAEPLTEQGRESTLQAFAGYIKKGQKEFLMGLKDGYTKEDWEWLIEKLDESDKIKFNQ